MGWQGQLRRRWVHLVNCEVQAGCWLYTDHTNYYCLLSKTTCNLSYVLMCAAAYALLLAAAQAYMQFKQWSFMLWKLTFFLLSNSLYDSIVGFQNLKSIIFELGSAFYRSGLVLQPTAVVVVQVFLAIDPLSVLGLYL